MEEKKQLRAKIATWGRQREMAQKTWSGVHHAALFGSIICSVVAGAQFKIFNHPDFATLLTTLAAVLTGIAASGGFERKWRSNRISRGRADCLLIDIDSDQADLAAIRKQFKSAIEKHDLEVVGSKNGGSDSDSEDTEEKSKKR